MPLCRRIPSGDEMITAEGQLWALALEEERIRVEKVQQDAKAAGKKTSVTFERTRVNKPWKWADQWKASLFDVDERLVLAVSRFDFDLTNGEFQTYLRERGLLHLAGTDGSTHWQLMNDVTTTEQSIFDSEAMQHAQEYQGSKHCYSEAEMKTRWRVFQFSRVMLQAAWDAFTEKPVPATIGEVDAADDDLWE